jgi:sulfur carrier protein ThiS
MTITLKLYASLSAFLPSEANGHKVSVEIDENTSALAVLDRYHVPMAQVHLVLVNGVFIAPSQRDAPLSEGDELAVWPAVAGG